MIGRVTGSLLVGEMLMVDLRGTRIGRRFAEWRFAESHHSRNEKPHLPLRAIKVDLPWDTYQYSDALDLHVESAEKAEPNLVK
ncbi:hypothetical protein [Spirosoma foliorum]|uniref:Uncharacterized protein n=1 Tax=Spirosoma foliorum TaxID=2710596 RepID=A0A7G5GQ49_9BACT|nr:hypothetical protein [Spirosoma foliorum]QMW00991.1 hypothetical protein H3H32_23840 [Spirosoma foliorum]